MTFSNPTYRRGTVWWANLNNYFQSSVKSGNRPVVIVSSDYGIRTSNIVTVCPLTTKLKGLSVNIPVDPLINNKPQQVLTNQLITVPKSALTSFSGYLSKDDMAKVDRGILTSLGLVNKTQGGINPESATPGRQAAELERLLSKAGDLISKLEGVVAKVDISKPNTGKRNYTKRTDEEIRDFIKEWSDPSSNKNEVALKFGFNSYSSAYGFYINHK